MGLPTPGFVVGYGKNAASLNRYDHIRVRTHWRSAVRENALKRAALPDGLEYLPGLLDPGAQRALMAAITARLRAAPLYTPRLPRSGKPMRVRMTNFGPLGWVTDKAGGYRYQAHHPETGAPWPGMPARLLQLWAETTGWPDPPEACLVNVYGEDARMSLHVDADEAAREAPVLSISLGDPALFRIGGQNRRDPTGSFWLRSGDGLVLSGPARHCFHGVDRIGFGATSLVPGGGRINLTLRRVTQSPAGD